MASCSLFFFVLMIRRPPRSTRTDTLFPYPTLFRSCLSPSPVYGRGVGVRVCQVAMTSWLGNARIKSRTLTRRFAPPSPVNGRGAQGMVLAPVHRRPVSARAELSSRSSRLISHMSSDLRLVVLGTVVSVRVFVGC